MKSIPRLAYEELTAEAIVGASAIFHGDVMESDGASPA